MIDTELTVDLKVTVPLRVTDFDRYGRIKPSAVLELFQEAATMQADVMDIGRAAMDRRGVFWVVVRTYYEVIKHPQLYSSVQIRTWPHSPSRFSFQRDYIILSMEGDVLVRGTSEWVLMDKETRSFTPLSDVYEAPDNLIDERNFEKKPRKLHDFSVPDEHSCVVIPPYTSVDINGHVNNSVYANYPFDAIKPGANRDIRDFQIDFRYEVHEGEPLRIYTLIEDDTLLAKGVDDDGNIKFAVKAGLTI